MKDREGVVKLKSFFSTVKDVFGLSPEQDNLDEKTVKEVEALRAESSKGIAELENKYTTTKLKERQSFEKDIKNEVKPVKVTNKTNTKVKEHEDNDISK